VTEVQSFLGFCNFYRQFIRAYSDITAPLTELVKGANVKKMALRTVSSAFAFRWTETEDEAFQQLKRAFKKASILIHFNPDLPVIVETDASNKAIAGIISHKVDGKLRPIAFHARKLNIHEQRYEIHDKELLAIIDCFKTWRPMLEGSPHQIIVYSDHQALKWFDQKRSLSHRQVRWMIFLQDYNYKIEYRPGRLSGKPDALSRRPDFDLTPSDRANDEAQLLHLNTLRARTEGDSILSKIREIYVSDKKYRKVKKALEDGTWQAKVKGNRPNKALELRNGLIYKVKTGQVWIPGGDSELRLQLLKEAHDSPWAGHNGIHKTVALLSRDYYWPGMRNTVSRYISSCETCASCKPRRHKPYGELQSIPAPALPWEVVTFDFIEKLPVSDGYDGIFVAVCALTKMAIFEPIGKMNTEQFCEMLQRRIISVHGVPKVFISDRGSRFTSTYFQKWCNVFRIKHKLSTAHHPQTDGQTEIVNQWLETYLRMFGNYDQDDWSKLLPIAEFAYNNAEHASTKKSPFYANYGFHPRPPIVFIPYGHKDERFSSAHRMADMHSEMQRLVTLAKEDQARYYNCHRMRPPRFKKNAFVWVSTQNINPLRKTRKLEPKFIKAKVSEPVGTHAYRVVFPKQHSRLHDVVNITYLEPYVENDFPGRYPSPPKPVEMSDGEEEHVIDHIVNSRYTNKRKQYCEYLVRWKGYQPSDDTWQLYGSLADTQALEEYHQLYPNKPRDCRFVPET